MYLLDGTTLLFVLCQAANYVLTISAVLIHGFLMNLYLHIVRWVGGKMRNVGKMGRFSIFASSPYPKVQLKCALCQLVDNTFALLPDELFAAEKLYSFEMRFLLHAHI